jgi:hypothetical protein
VDEIQLRRLIRQALERTAMLPATSPTRSAASQDWLTALARSPQEAIGPDGSLPPLLLHLAGLELDQIIAVDEDITTVQRCAPNPPVVGKFLEFGRSTSRNNARQWFSGRVELALHAHLLGKLSDATVSIEPLLPNGKRADVAIWVDKRWVWIECTALSNADAESEDISAITAKWGDPYQDARRVYRKAFDKVSGAVGDMRSQLHPEHPSVLLVVDAAWISPGLKSMGADWAVTQMTQPSARSDTSQASLVNWARRDYKEHAEKALASLTCMSAVALLSYDLRRVEVTSNTGCDESHELSGVERSALTGLLTLDRPWLQ